MLVANAKYNVVFLMLKPKPLTKVHYELFMPFYGLEILKIFLKTISSKPGTFSKD